jgi:hypothetical protein
MPPRRASLANFDKPNPWNAAGRPWIVPDFKHVRTVDPFITPDRLGSREAITGALAPLLH